MEKQQREFLLRQQLAAIRKELAELDGKPGLRGGRLPGPDRGRRPAGEGREAALKEAAKLERGSDQSPEASWIRTWLDTMPGDPVEHPTDDAYDIAAAGAVLDAGPRRA
jgi:ATP-dependent Lon protease